MLEILGTQQPGTALRSLCSVLLMFLQHAYNMRSREAYWKSSLYKMQGLLDLNLDFANEKKVQTSSQPCGPCIETKVC
jgi:hypothetical protein